MFDERRLEIAGEGNVLVSSQTSTLTPTTAARRMLRSWLSRTPIENQQPGMPVSRSTTPNIFMPSLLTA